VEYCDAVVCISLAMALCGVILELSGLRRIQSLGQLFVGAVGLQIAISVSVLQAIPAIMRVGRAISL